MVKSILLDFFGFLKRPNDVQYNWSFSKKLTTFFVIFCIELLFACLIILPLFEYLQKSFVIDNQKLNYSEYTISFLIGFGVILAPIVEEGIFRLVQRYQGFTEMLFTRKKWDKIFPYIVYSLSIFFGLIHLLNYTNNTELLLKLSPILIGSQLIGGLALSYLRVRFNLYWSIFYHIIWNLSVIIIIPYLLFSNIQAYTDLGKNYNLEVKESLFYQPKKPQTFYIDTLKNGKIKRIATEQLSLQHTLDTIYGKNKYQVNDFIANIKFESELGISKDSLITIINKEYKVFK